MSKLNLVTRTERYCSLRYISPARAVNQIHSCLLEPFCKLNRLFYIPAVLNPVGRGDPDEQRDGVGYFSSDCTCNFQGNPASVLQTSPVHIFPFIRKRGEELVY